MPTVSARLRLLLALPALVLSAACGSQEPRAGVQGEGAAVEEYPGTVYARVTGLRMAEFPGADTAFLAPVTLVPCAGGTGEQRAATIGREGGRIVLSRAGHELIIPAEAVDRSYQFILRDVPAGDHLVVSATPHGIRFNVPALLVLNLERCSPAPDTSRLMVVRVNDKGHPADDLGGTISENKISARLGHLSAYALSVPRDESQ